jgi:hypothetical protein
LADARSDTRFWGAYVLGHHSQSFRIWQDLFWHQPSDDYGTRWSVHLAAADLRSAGLALVGHVIPIVGSELAASIGRLERIHARVVATYDQSIARAESRRPRRRGAAGRAKTGFHPDGVSSVLGGASQHLGAELFGRGKAPGEEAWLRLRCLTDRALPGEGELAPWYDLGATVGRCEYESTGDPASVIEGFRAIARAAWSIPADRRVQVPQLQRLAELVIDPTTAGGEEGLRHFVRGAEGVVWHYGDLDPVEESWALANSLHNFDRHIQDHLLVMPRSAPERPQLRPTWNSDRGILIYSGVTAKQIGPRATNVRPILAAFEEEG